MGISSLELGAEVCVAHRWKPQATHDCMEILLSSVELEELGGGNLRLVHRHWRGRVEGGEDGHQASLQQTGASSFHMITLELVHPWSSAKCRQGPCAMTCASTAVSFRNSDYCSVALPDTLGIQA